jgi:hypothetical protein
MHIPIPDGRAEECAKDLAQDCRNIGAEAMQLKEAIAAGEANSSDKKNYETLVKQIQSLADVVCVDLITGAEFRVGDYVTKKLEILAALKRWKLERAYRRLHQWLH